MLIITADDFGIDKQATDSILFSYKTGRITSISAMVFMQDSVRAAEMASGLDVEIGFHLNLTLPLSGSNANSKLLEHQHVVASFLLSSKFTQIIYNPLLRKSFDFVFKTQEEEFHRLYKSAPAFYNGHHHMHLCANIIFGKYLPREIPIRRTFTFGWGEKDPFNIIYRRLLDHYISRRYISSDAFYSLAPVEELEKINKIISLSEIKNIELMVHPNRKEEFQFLQSDYFSKLIRSAEIGSFASLKASSKK